MPKGETSTAQEPLAVDSWRAEPYLHIEEDRIYNPLTDRTLTPRDDGYESFRRIVLGSGGVDELFVPLKAVLIDEGWLVSAAQDRSRRFRLMYVSLEAHTVCNQACYFCPVAI